LVFGFLVAVFGILQHHTFNGRLYWLRTLSAGGIPFGPFVNRNHFAGLMEMIAAPGIALLFFRGVPRDRLPLVALFTVLPVGALFLSASRGGVATFLFQLLLFGALLFRRPAGRRGLVYAALVLLLVAGFLMWLDVGRVFDRFADPQPRELTHDRRVSMVRDTWRIFLDHPLKGIGFGSLVSVFPRYESVYDGRVVDHAHNDFVELLAEGGILGGLLGLGFVLLLYLSCFRRLEEEAPPFIFAVRAGAWVACSGLLLHGLVDFNLHIPSNALLFLLMAVLATAEVAGPADSRPGARNVAVVFSA
jgi:O-antigen ligase